MGLGAPATPIDTVTSITDELNIPFGKAEAGEIRDLVSASSSHEAVWARLYRIDVTGYGTQGIGQTGSVPSLAPDTYGENLVIFKAQKASDCDRGTVADQWGSLPGQSGSSGTFRDVMDRPAVISDKYSQGPKTDSQLYCLATKVTATSLANTATATGTAPDGTTVTATDTWNGYRLPDPAAEGAVSFDFKFNFFGPN
jgi:hypothetical protein